MIPLKIHYCWFGRNPKPKLAEKCVKSWKKHCPDYEIIEWNEDNFDISQCPLYVRQAYEKKKWAFVTDYVRLQVVYEHGGIYMDTDVELKKTLDPLLIHKAYFGFEDGECVNSGLGFGAVAGHPVLRKMMDDYRGISFIKEDGSFDSTPCPQRNTQIFLDYGLKQDDSRQIIGEDILILPSVYLCPISYHTKERTYSSKTISIHWFDASWQTESEKKQHAARVRKQKIDKLIHLPNRILMKLLGEANYQKLKHVIKRG